MLAGNALGWAYLAEGYAGSVSSGGNATVTGVRALATVTGTAGTPKVCVTGVRALVTVTGKPGACVTGGSIAVIGARALVTVTGRPGTPKIVLNAGTRALATAAGRAGTPKVRVGGVRATATVVGQPGATSGGTSSHVGSPSVTTRTRVRVTARA